MLNIYDCEQKIEQLLAVKERNWKDVARIAIQVREGELYQQLGLNSYTAWVKAIAQKCERQPSLFWRYIKAAQYYLQLINSENIEDINGAKAAPETLVNLEKIQKNAPQEVYQSLKTRVLEGKATRKETRAIEQQLRLPKGNNNRFGQPSQDEVGQYRHLGNSTDRLPNPHSNLSQNGDLDLDSDGGVKAEMEFIEESDRILEHTQSISQHRSLQTAANAVGIVESPKGIAPVIAQSLKTCLSDWTRECAQMRYLPTHYVAYSEVRVNLERRRLRLDLVAVTRWSNKKPKDIFGVEIKSSLADFDRDMKWENYLPFCHYFCFAVLEDNRELVQKIESQTPDYVGILLVNRHRPLEEKVGYEVTIHRLPSKLESKQEHTGRIYETLFERVQGWSESESDFN